MRTGRTLLIAAALLVTGGAALAAEQVRAELLVDAASMAPGATITAGIHLAIEPGWHVYWRNPGDSGQPVRVTWKLPAGMTAGELRWPTPRRFGDAGVVGFGYEGGVTLLADLRLPDPLPPEADLRFVADVRWLACAEACIPGSATVTRSSQPGLDAYHLSLAPALLPATPGPTELRIASATIEPAGSLVLKFDGEHTPAIVDVIPDVTPGAVVDYGGMVVADGTARLPIAAPVPAALPSFEAIVITGRGADARGWIITVPATAR